jgi:hypothetical protein
MNRVFVHCLCLCFLLSLATVASANPVTYVYTGKHFNIFGGSGYTTDDFVSGYITFAEALPSNATISDAAIEVIQPQIVDWSFSDGVQTISDNGFNFLFLFKPDVPPTVWATGSNGIPTSWYIEVHESNSQVVLIVTCNDTLNNYQECGPPPAPEDTGQAGFAAASAVQEGPGTWSIYQPPTVTEPGTLSLAICGLALLIPTGIFLHSRAVVGRLRSERHRAVVVHHPHLEG